jgi:Leucine-rich repeat (LRR) protein
MNPKASSLGTDAQVNRLLASDDIANVLLGLQLAANTAIELTDLSSLWGLALLERQQEIVDSAIESLQFRIGGPVPESLAELWQPTHLTGSARHLFNALAKLERKFRLEKGSLQKMAVIKLDRFPDHVAHRHPHAFRTYCEHTINAHGHLSFAGVRMPELPKAISKVSAITSIDFSHCGLKLLPEHIGDLQQLEHLDCSQIGLSDLPRSLALLPKLHSLELNGKTLQQMPPVLAECKHLRVLRIKGGQNRLLEGIGHLTQLLEFSVDAGNALDLPEEIGSLKGLRDLSLRNLFLDSLPNSIVGCIGLESLNVEGNSLKRLPDIISDLTALQELKLSAIMPGCNLPSLWGLNALESLEVAFKNWTHLEFPESWCELPELRSLIIDGPLTELPNCFSRLKQMVGLRLSGGKFKEFPAILSVMENLQCLEIHAAEFGTHEFDLRKMTSLETLKLNHCGLRDLPPWLGEMPRLKHIHLFNNHLPWPEVAQFRAKYPEKQLVI